jgi:uncharacterized protein YqfB (UPF0267 family)
MSTPELQQRLARLDAAIQSGEKTVSLADGSSVTYRSLDEMRAVRRDLAASMAPASRPRLQSMRVNFGTIRGG